MGRPGKGNDKGKVEGLVDYSRSNFMVPPLGRFAMQIACRAMHAAFCELGCVQRLSRGAMPQSAG